MNDRPPHNDDHPPQADLGLSKRRYGTRKVPVTRALCRQVKALREAQVSEREISVQLGIPLQTVRHAIKRIEVQRLRASQRLPEAEQGRHYRLLHQIADEAMAPRFLRDKKGNLVFEVVDGKPTTNPVKIPLTPARAVKAMKALREIRIMLGWQPVKKRKSRRHG